MTMKQKRYDLRFRIKNRRTIFHYAFSIIYTVFNISYFITTFLWWQSYSSMDFGTSQDTRVNYPSRIPGTWIIFALHLPVPATYWKIRTQTVSINRAISVLTKLYSISGAERKRFRAKRFPRSDTHSLSAISIISKHDGAGIDGVHVRVFEREREGRRRAWHNM